MAINAERISTTFTQKATRLETPKGTKIASVTVGFHGAQPERMEAVEVARKLALGAFIEQWGEINMDFVVETIVHVTWQVVYEIKQHPQD